MKDNEIYQRETQEKMARAVKKATKTETEVGAVKRIVFRIK
jgi:hypothetical protein